MSLTNYKVQPFTFLSNVTGSSDGAPFTVEDYRTITFEVIGTSPSLAFEGAGPSGAYLPVVATNISTNASATSTTGTSELWQVDVTGLDFFRVRQVSGTGVTVKGKAVA